eukprot:CAMPEP_0113946114 /NCGR_PEP_ID=MMETSP1339-20121228/54619_1 /TAXON_ID=94617 /ORGANISM="Fibrocapsa japonica" /LENGTH=185 /DNA_ID=CAMNT_0000952037 /DNA_START=49 /DNA_END=606 /DNA_ORIENTATION=+ /assembly_acc=CAM_ASM_000762
MANRVVIVPGNGCTDVLNSNWYGWLADEIRQKWPGVDVIVRDMPDPYVAKESIWIPFIKEDIGVHENSIVIGHSSGAVCAMRLLETTKLLGAILVATCYTDLGDSNERASGYFSRPWLWDEIKGNADFIHQFHSTDDPLIPVAEARFVAEQLQGDNHQYDELTGKSHFFQPFPEILDVLDNYLVK